MALKPSDYKLVQVHWNDAESHNKWVEMADAIADDSMECVSLGWVISDKPDRLIIVSSMSLGEENGLVSGHLTIPRPMIIQVKELAIKRAKKAKVEAPAEQNATI